VPRDVVLSRPIRARNVPSLRPALWLNSAQATLRRGRICATLEPLAGENERE